MTDQEYEVHDHGWWYIKEDSCFKCDYESENGNHCTAQISLDSAVKFYLPKGYDTQVGVTFASDCDCCE